jgi:single-stranded-DNA-specific exonuclease
MHNVAFKKRICIIVDSDCDGFTSSAILINYLYDLSPDYTRENVFWFFHEGKQHGLEDAMDWINTMDPNLVIIPDAGSNDLEEIQQLTKKGIGIIILDHHDLEGERPNALLINSQLQPYQNKELSGAGVVYQFCRAMDIMYDSTYADSYLDLCALGLIGDMMSLRSFETRRLITLGLIPDNIKNPFIYEMWQKNKFKLTDTPTAWGFTFYIVPFVNAINRSGTAEEKALIFNSMLKFKAFEEIPSNKRGHKLGETEKLVEQAVRTCTNVKNRQTRDEEKGLELVEHLIKDNNMMDHKVLLFLLKPGAIKAEIRGLIANKLMAKYQRPCCMLTERVKEDGTVTYEGSARGCDKVDVTDFKSICAATGVCDYTVGHPGALD